MNSILGICISLFATVILAVVQLILKKASGKSWNSKIREYLNLPVISAYGLSFIATFISVYSMKYIPVAIFAVINGAGQIFVPILSTVFLKEKLSKKKWIGIVVISIGIIVVSLG